MAKQPVNIIERHLEKGVLGLCAAVLLAAIVMFLVSTPNKIDLGGSMVGPGDIDQHIRDAGQQLANRLRNAQADEANPVDFKPLFEQASSPLAAAGIERQWHAPVPFLPPVPEIGEAPPRAGEIKLAAVVSPESLKATAGRSTLFLTPAVPLGETGELATRPPATDVNWITVGGMFDQQQQIEVYKKAGYKATRRNPYLVGVDLQRRERLPDGSYGDWQDVPTYKPKEMPSYPNVEIVEGRKGMIATDTTRDGIRDFFNLVRENQIDVLRPMFPEKKYGDDWLYPKFDNTDIPSLDQELCVPGAECPTRDYPVQTDLKPVVPEIAKSPRELAEEAVLEAKRLLDQEFWELAIDKAAEIATMEGATQDHKNRADDITREANQLIRDEELGRLPPRSDRDSDEDSPADVPRSRYQVIWAHDAASEAAGGAKSDRTYQYRMRLRLYNRFCAVPSDLADPNDAKKVEVVGEWSQPTPDIYIPPDTRFFLTRGDTNSRTGAKVTAFKWYEGTWVEHDFDIAEGMPIRDASRETVRITPQGTPDRPLVDFNTGCTVVDIDYGYLYRSKRDRGNGFVVENSPGTTVALIYTDPNGDLRQRIMEKDRRSDEYKLFKDLVPDFSPRRR